MIRSNVKENVIIETDDNMNIIIQPDDYHGQKITQCNHSAWWINQLLSLRRIKWKEKNEKENLIIQPDDDINVIIKADDNTVCLEECFHPESW
jgi:hypothetical protein